VTRGRGKLRILYIVSIMPPHAGGAAIDYASFVRGVGGERHKDTVESVTVLTEKGCRRDYGPLVRIKDSLSNYDTAENRSLLAQLRNYATILRHILFGGYDIVHIHARYVYARYAGRAVWLALALSRANAVVDLRDRFYNGFGFGVNFIVCSDGLREYYSRIKGARCIPVPLDLPDTGAWKKGGDNLAYFGTIAANKGVMELIDGFALYREKESAFKELHLYGANAMGDRFLRAIEGKKGVRYMGVVESGEVMRKITEFKAVALPSMSEGMPRVCLETMYCAKPIICHRNIKSILPCIPDEFVLDGLAPKEFARVLEKAAKVEGPVEYGYDFTAHHPESVCSLLVKEYGEIRAPGRRKMGEGQARLLEKGN